MRKGAARFSRMGDERGVLTPGGEAALAAAGPAVT
jgi:hypothetical protein